MKQGIHPNYVDARIVCACGAVYETKSTQPLIKVEICAQCHPFYTGKKKIVDTAGRVEKFVRKYERYRVKEEKQAEVEKEASEGE